MSDWLALEAPAKVPDLSWLDAPKKVVVRRREPRTSQREALTQAMRKLPVEHRILLKSLSQSGWNLTTALKRMAAIGHPVTGRTARNWRRSTDFIAAKELMAEIMLRSTGADANQILLRTNAIAEHCAEEEEVFHQGVPMLDALGNRIKRLRDAPVALRANELLGKNKQLWGEEAAQTRVTVNIVDLSGIVDGGDRPIEVIPEVDRG